MDEKKGTGQRPEPKTSVKRHDSRISRLCLGVNMISIILFLVGYARGNDRVIYTAIGMLIASLVMLMAVMNEEDE